MSIQIKNPGSILDFFKKHKSIVPTVCFFFAASGVNLYESAVVDIGEPLFFYFLFDFLVSIIGMLSVSYIYLSMGSAVLTEDGSFLWIREASGRFWFGMMGCVCVLWGIMGSIVFLNIANVFVSMPFELSGTRQFVIKAGILLVAILVNIICLKKGKLLNIQISKKERMSWYKTALKAFLISILVGLVRFLLLSAQEPTYLSGIDDFGPEPGNSDYTSVIESGVHIPIFYILASALSIALVIAGQWAITSMCIAFTKKFWGESTGKSSKVLIGIIITTVSFIVLFDEYAYYPIFVYLLLTGLFCVVTLVAISFHKKRSRKEEKVFIAAIGKVDFRIIASICLVFCLLIPVVGGTDTFLTSFAMMIILPLFYTIGQWIRKKSAARKAALSSDSQHRLGFGDYLGLGGYYIGFGLFGILGSLFLKAREGEEVTGYWVSPEDMPGDTYEFQILKEFKEEHPDVSLPPPNEAGEVYIPGWYEMEYGSGIFANFELMLNLIKWISIGATAAGIIFVIVGKYKSRKKRKMRVTQ